VGAEQIGSKERLKLGITLPFDNTLSTYPSLSRMARAVQDCGFDAVWMADHLTGPSPNGTALWFDLITLLANLCAHVPKLIVGTDVLVAGHRHPVAAAKMLATLDHVSSGRLIVGVGVGYIEKEFDELGAPFKTRGEYTDECLRVWKALWAPGKANVNGKYFTLRDTTFEPKPLQNPHPPLWVGSHAPPVLRRAVALADGWHPIYQTIPQYEAGVATLRRLADEMKRERPLTLSYSGAHGWVRPEADESEKRFPLSGSPAQVIEDIGRLQALGVTNIVFRPGAMGKAFTTEEICEQIEFIAKNVLPQVRR